MVIPLNPEGMGIGNDSFSFVRTLREWEGEWAIRKNFAREREFLKLLASQRGSLRPKITIFLGVQVFSK